jgi:uncharacterized membrane protein
LFEFLFKYPREDYARSELIFVGHWPAWVLAVVAVIAVIGISIFLYRRHGFVRGYQLAAIWMLQIAMVALVVWVLAQPTLSTERLRAGENTVALVLDVSESMAFGNAESRFQQALRSLSGVVQADAALNLSVRHYELGETATAVTSFLESQPTATSTSIADSLEIVLREARFSPLAAVVLSSDGADTSGGLSVDELAAIAAFGVPVHTVAVGRTAIPEDIELTDITLPDKVLPGSTLSARVSIRHDAPASTQVKVYAGDNLLALVPVELRADAGITTARVEFEIAEAGHHRLLFSVDGVPGETELRNNSRSTLVEVANQKYRILYFEGEPRWEYKFLRRAISNDEDLQVVSLLRVSPNKFYRQGIDTPEQLESGFPTTREELFAYDALIIGSVEAASLSAEQQVLIRDFVSERGGSLLMIAGPNGLGNGGWGQSEIADVLPLSLPPSSIPSFFRKKASVELTPQGADTQMLRFADTLDANRQSWSELPNVADYQVTGSLKPAAVTLLNVDTDIGQMPLLVTHPFGRGHAWILASGGTWRWQMSLPLEDQRHETFWRQLLRALVASSPQRVSLTASGGSGDSNIVLRAEFRDEEFRPVDDIGVTAQVSHEDGESWSVNLQASAADPGVFTAEIDPTESGTWYFEAVAHRNDEAVATARASIHYDSGQAEYFNIRRDSAQLRALSEATGGQYLEPQDLDALPDLLRYSSSGITVQEYRAIWDAPAIFILLLMLKAGEWLLRRRWSTI